ncbi:monoxygenase [Talaromyces pinophilus]|uniref:Monoxygenase n=1 Tax=Talaromyces pinophilus TaxID=128442 RepID=A0A6V8HEE9_TALPI|nr:monoxygenase [Talaromyces pinophilus]
MMASSQAPIAIIGAGPAGLTFARLLELANIPYIVFERVESALWADEHSSSADGAWSKVRKLLTPAEPQYLGTHFFTTFLKPDNPYYSWLTSMVGNGNYLALSKGRQFFLHYLGDGSYHLAVGMKLPENWNPDPTKLHEPSALWQSLLQHEFVEWSPEIRRLIQSATHGYRSWPLYSISRASVPWEHVPGVTLLGDAAHLTGPGGDGVNNALHDSVELARQIIKHGIDNLDSAVVKYEEAMFPRAVEAINKGQWAVEHLFSAESSQSFLQAAMQQ